MSDFDKAQNEWMRRQESISDKQIRAFKDGFHAALSSQQPEAVAWQLIETCPPYKMVLLYCPENSPWAATVWKGRKSGGDSRNYGYDIAYSIATPYGQDGKQVWCPVEESKWPTHWMPIPEAP